MKNSFFAILCGGRGERLWPLSRKNKPKQFISFFKNKSLLEQTLERISPLVTDKNNIGVVTNSHQEGLINKFVGDKIGFSIQEPDARNTGPAILYSCFKLMEKNKDAVVVFLPADSFVLDNDEYRECIKKAINYTNLNNEIVIVGLMPTRPATGYGYIQAASGLGNDITAGNIYKVKKFHEKPDVELAKKYMHQNDMFWNIGVFVSKASVFIEEFKLHAPEIYLGVENFIKGKSEYKDILSLSVDYAVMEKSSKVSVLPSVFEWDDVGNIDVFLRLQRKIQKDTNNIINFEAVRNIVHLSEKSKDKLVVFMGVNDICLVEEDDVVFVAKRSEVEKVKNVLGKIKEESLEKFL